MAWFRKTKALAKHIFCVLGDNMLQYFVLRAVFGLKNWNDGNGKMLVGDGDRG